MLSLPARRDRRAEIPLPSSTVVELNTQASFSAGPPCAAGAILTSALARAAVANILFIHLIPSFMVYPLDNSGRRDTAPAGPDSAVPLRSADLIGMLRVAQLSSWEYPRR